MARENLTNLSRQRLSAVQGTLLTKCHQFAGQHGRMRFIGVFLQKEGQSIDRDRRQQLGR